MGKLAVLAIGGNSIIKDAAHQTVEDQLQAIKETSRRVVELIAGGLNVVVTHGNGPQVGFILRRSEIAWEANELHQVPLKNCVADTQGALGYQLQEALSNELRRNGLRKQAVTVITQVEVDAHDPSFANPAKPIGSFLSRDRSLELARKNPDWKFKDDSGRGWRRVVPSPAPKSIVELYAIKTLLAEGCCVIAAGGGGIPVAVDQEGDLQGVDAVVDKDLTASLLARSLGAELMIISTSVERVYRDFGTPAQQGIARMTLAQAERYISQGQFAPGSMLPKVQAVMAFLRQGGEQGVITSPENLGRAMRPEVGTHMVPD